MKEEKYGVGKVFTNNWNEEFEIIENLGNGKRKIRFTEDLYIRDVHISTIGKGHAKNTNKDIYAIGTIHECSDGNFCQIIGRGSSRNLRIIKFLDDGYVCERNIGSIRSGARNENTRDKILKVGNMYKDLDGNLLKLEAINNNELTCLNIKDNKIIKISVSRIITAGKIKSKEDSKYSINKVFKTNEGYNIKIIDIINYNWRVVVFENGYKTNVVTTDIRYGKIANPYHRTCCGVGYIGDGEYNSIKNKKEYSRWSSMVARCYENILPQYKNVTVCEEWLNFQVYCNWELKSYPIIENLDFQLDKDLLQSNLKNKIYSPETCVFLPKKINVFLANVDSKNTSGYTGVSWDKTNNKWVSKISEFNTNKSIYLGRFINIEEASLAYQKARAEQSEKAKQYLRDLNYLPEEIIQLIK